MKENSNTIYEKKAEAYQRILELKNEGKTLNEITNYLSLKYGFGKLFLLRFLEINQAAEDDKKLREEKLIQ